MTKFEYVATFVSILYAIMVGRSVSTLAGLSFRRANWLHLAWIAILLVNILQAWWIRWGGHDYNYHYGWFVLSIAHVIPLMFAVATLSPTKQPDDWSAYMDTNRVRFFSAYGAFWIVVGISYFIGSANWQVTVFPAFLCILGAVLNYRLVQIAIPAIFAAMFILIGTRMALDGV